MFHTLAVAGEYCFSVELIHRQIKFMMGVRKRRRHGVHIVKICEGCGFEFGARVEYALRQGRNPRALFFISFGPRKGVVHNANGISVIALEPSADMA